MSKSVVIIGKGPSVLKSTKEFVDSFDEVAICNFPPMEGYEQFIGTRATYHFFNSHDPNPYKKEILNALGLKYMFNTHTIPHDGYKRSFPDHEVKYVGDYGTRKVPQFKSQYGFDPSTGIQAFDFFVTKKEFTAIGLAGIDFFKVSERGYYYPPAKVQPTLRYLYTSTGKTPFDLEGTRILESLHDSKKSENFVHEMIEYYNKELRHPQ
jgi:hypothetical protein